MNIAKITLVLMTVGTLAVAAPAFAASSGMTGGGQNSGAGNQANGTVGDNPDATDPTDNCFRRTRSGHESKIVCPTDPSMSSTGKSGLTTSTQ
jgi:hypothetical protein